MAKTSHLQVDVIHVDRKMGKQGKYILNQNHPL